MDHIERKLSDYIDRLNAEKKPDEHNHPSESDELEELFQTVRKVRSLRDPAMPEPNFQKKLSKSLEVPISHKKPEKFRKWAWVLSMASVAAIIVLMVNLFLPIREANIVNAMEKAFKDVKAYHGTLEIVETNKSGRVVTQAKLDVWADKNGQYYIKGLEGANKNLITANNGQKKWQVQPDKKQVHLFPPFPDAYRFIFELGNEINALTNAMSTKVIGDDTVAGRKAAILEVTPKGGSPYRIWIDKETKLPLQKQTAMHNAIQYKITYTTIDFKKAIPNELLIYQVPTGFTEINTNPEQLVNDIDEAEKTVGFALKLPKAIPVGYSQDHLAILLDKKLVKIYYKSQDKEKTIIVAEGKTNSKFRPVPNAILGKIYNEIAEVQSPVQEEVGVLSGGSVYPGSSNINSIRWQHSGVEFAVVGNSSIKELTAFTNALTNSDLIIPAMDGAATKPQVEVPYDLTVEKNDQKSVDAGSSPWRLDPAFTSQVFVSLQLSPEGITGDYPIDTKDLNISYNDGKKAIVEVNSEKSPITKVYLKRLVRQDSTGIWTVVGFDRINQ